MDDYKIILFCCNWGPHAALLTLQDQRADIPNEVKMVRMPEIIGQAGDTAAAELIAVLKDRVGKDVTFSHRGCTF